MAGSEFDFPTDVWFCSLVSWRNAPRAIVLSTPLSDRKPEVAAGKPHDLARFYLGVYRVFSCAFAPFLCPIATFERIRIYALDSLHHFITSLIGGSSHSKGLTCSPAHTRPYLP